MQDSNPNKRENENNDKLISDFAATKQQSRSLYRNWAVTSRKLTGSSSQPLTNVFSRISACNVGNDCVENSQEFSGSNFEERADKIVRHIEQTLSEDNPKSKNDRIEFLRGMIEYLTVKRCVKKKLSKSIVSTHRTLTFSKRLKYNISIFFLKIPVTIRHFTSSFELWYSSLKVIEGHFGSNVASYFKFLRKLFLLNACIFILMLFFVMIPQLLFRLFQYVDDNQATNSSNNFNNVTNKEKLSFHVSGPEAKLLVMKKANPYEENGEFRLGDVFTGEGFLTNTILFYGYYTNTSLQLIKGHSYNIPAAYFFTSVVCYTIIFVFLFTSVAVSYRKCYIEASGSMHNTFSNKVFCGWDFGIATRHAAELKSKSFYIEFKELLDDISKPTKKKTCLSTFYTTAISFSLNGLLLFLLVVGGTYSWKFLDQQMTKADTATTMMMWLILTLVVALAPVLFSFIAHLEGFESPSSALYMTLIRTFILYAIVIAVVVAFRLNRSNEFECWETVLGQDMFRLVVLDFIFGSIGTALSEFIRYRIFIKMWRGIGCPEFDIARSTMSLIYNQTLFYIGLFFSPVLSLLITTKLFIIFYLKKWGAIYNCKLFVRPWRASQAYTVYLSIAFFAFFCVVIAYGYIITSVKTSNCGPFRGEKYLYERLLEEILLNKNSSSLMVLYYITRPGVVGIVLMAMLLGVYYMRAVALARIHVVKHLQHLLRLKAEDRKLLLNELSKYNKNQDPPDSPTPENLSRPQSPCDNLSDEKSSTKEDKFFNHSKKSNLSSSSMSNIYCDKDSKLRKSIFNSAININNSSNTPDNVEVHYKFNQSPDENADENVRKEIYPSVAERKLKFENETSSERSKNAPVDIKNEDLIENVDEEYLSRKGALNFNPVFTESVLLQSDDEGEFLDFTKTGSTIKRLDCTHEEQKPLAEQERKFPFKSNFKGEDRVPSRISFISDRKKHH